MIAHFGAEELERRLIEFLQEGAREPLSLIGEMIEPQTARELLQEVIPARIEVRSICARRIAAVAAAPHASFDNWSEYFCNRAARRLGLGRVIAINFRDQDRRKIPLSIGRHIHVNRPFESDGPGEPERETERAREIHEEYLAALCQASGRETLPMDLLVEFHSHRQTPFHGSAATGLSADRARELADAYQTRREREPRLPELRIEPLHELQWRAEAAKAYGSLRAEVARCGLHIEIPREMRLSEPLRSACSEALIASIAPLLDSLEETSHRR